jgi:hypothetical protein
MLRKNRGKADPPFYTIQICIPKHGWYLFFSFLSEQVYVVGTCSLIYLAFHYCIYIYIYIFIFFCWFSSSYELIFFSQLCTRSSHLQMELIGMVLTNCNFKFLRLGETNQKTSLMRYNMSHSVSSLNLLPLASNQLLYATKFLLKKKI